MVISNPVDSDRHTRLMSRSCLSVYCLNSRDDINPNSLRRGVGGQRPLSASRQTTKIDGK
eukprot:150652-Heterocapsa_arctica.AAC.1